MKTSLRFVALTAALSVAIWGGPARSSYALSCDGPFPTPCTVGDTTTCTDGLSIRNCECVSVGTRARWLCFW